MPPYTEGGERRGEGEETEGKERGEGERGRREGKERGRGERGRRGRGKRGGGEDNAYQFTREIYNRLTVQ